jgi:outer membrane receptor for ferrienterochelin and colicins
MYRIYISLILFLFFTSLSAQKYKTDANIVGHVTSGGEHLQYATIAVKGTAIGTFTDETGHFQLTNLPPGEKTVTASCVGYKPVEKIVVLSENQTLELKFDLEEDLLNLSEIVVSVDRSEQKRTDAPVIVNTISPRMMVSTNSVTLSEVLNFSPGLRIENNCQNCGFTQVRMNGMEGPYSQILINSRPIFSGLAGVYGLELLPANMIERVEVVRGGGSALFGSNAIAGTINIILKEPSAGSYELGINAGLAGIGQNTGTDPAGDYSASFNSSYVSSDSKTGFAIFGFVRERGLYDANNDSFSEISPMSNTTAGAQFTHRFGSRSRLTADLFNIVEKRNGGNRQDYPLHERDLAEAVEHDIKTGALTFEKYFRELDLLSVYGSTQYLNRDSYYGANRSLDSYGATTDLTYNAGIQYKARFAGSSLIAGAELTGGRLNDTKLGYPDLSGIVINDDTVTYLPHTENTVITNQLSLTKALFMQYEATIGKASLVLGGRYDNYNIRDLKSEERTRPGHVFSPRASLRYEITPTLQGRLSYSKGFRAPQIFDEDLHIETSGSRQVINKNDPDLKEETSHSFMASIDMNSLIGSVRTGLLVEGFYTRLNDPFVNDIGVPDSDGTVIYTRRNATDGATVKGVNIELKLKPLTHLEVSSGLTLQSSSYEKPQEFGETRFFRSPASYGYFAVDLDLTDALCITSTGSYTGKMLIPYFGPTTDPLSGELRTSDTFFDLGVKISYDIRLNGSTLQLITGLKNIFNSYQSDFDSGINRDPSYIYGPMSPRMVYAGIRIGNQISDRNTAVKRKPTTSRVEQSVLSPGKVNDAGGKRKHRRKGW